MSLQRARQFVRRRRAVLAGTLALGAAAVAGLAHGVPSAFVARAVVKADVGYQGAVAGIVAHVVSGTAVAEARDLAGWDRAEPDPPRLRVPGRELVGISTRPDGSVDRLEVQVAGRTRQGALRAAGHLADAICDEDRARRERARRNATPKGDVLPGPTWVELHDELATLRQAHPGLSDANLPRRRAQAASSLADAEQALEAAEVRLAGAKAEAARLAALVDVEATRLFSADRIARQARAEAERQRRRQAEQEAAAARRNAGQAAQAAAGARVAELEAELERLLVTRKRRHPDVRRVLRQLEVERRRSAAEPQPEPTSAERSAARPVSPSRYVLAGADDEGAVPGNLGSWKQRAPSYAALQEAVRRQREVEVELDVAQRRHADRRQREATLVAAEQALEEPRREEQRLIALLEEVERRTPTRSGQATPLRPPLVITDRGTFLGETGLRPWWPAGAGLAVLLALLAGLLAERWDRTLYEITDLGHDLGVPVLGVIPKIRGGR